MSKDIKKALEHCIEWNCVECPNREELGSGETVCRGRLLPDVLEYVSDLEAKLAESEADKKTLICDYESRITKEQELMSRLEHNNEELKQQLAGKDKEIEEVSSSGSDNQDKISFAVEQLEKVKKNIKKVPIIDFDLSGNFEKMYKQDAIRQIDNQIKELKGENQ